MRWLLTCPLNADGWPFFPLTLWLTLCFCARSFRHTPLSHVPAIHLRDMMITIIIIINSKCVKISEQWGVSGLERGSAINHCRWKEELLIQNWAGRTLFGDFMWFLMTWLAQWSDTFSGQGVDLIPYMLCVVSLPRWVSSLFTGEPTQPSLVHNTNTISAMTAMNRLFFFPKGWQAQHQLDSFVHSADYSHHIWWTGTNQGAAVALCKLTD